MQIICISRNAYSGGQGVAERLATKLGYTCLSREELIEAATREGIQVGKLEMTMVKPGGFNERLALERDHYLAFSTAYLCEKALAGGLVYHGRTGHLLLPGLSHVLRVRVITDEERRVTAVMQNLGLSHDKARRYILEVDEDQRRWVHSMYGISWDDAANYDLVINTGQLSLENAASALVNMSQLPDFQITPASREAMQNLYLAARVRIKIARDERTFRMAIKVRADHGQVTVTYLPKDGKAAEFIPLVCRDIDGLTDLQLTMAMTNLLWIQEEYEPESDLFKQVVEIATKWNAAVELVRYVAAAENPPENDDTEPVLETTGINGEYTGGIEDDVSGQTADEGGLEKALDELADLGKSGGGRVVYGDQRQLINTIDQSIPYTLVVVGDLFKSYGHSARLRATRDLRSFLSARIKAPVVISEELVSHYLFTRRDILPTAAFLLVTLVIFLLIFANQEFVLAFLARAGWFAEAIEGGFLSKAEWLPKVVVSLAVFIVAPVVAYTYGNVIQAVLKLIKME